MNIPSCFTPATFPPEPETDADAGTDADACTDADADPGNLGSAGREGIPLLF